MKLRMQSMLSVLCSAKVSLSCCISSINRFLSKALRILSNWSDILVGLTTPSRGGAVWKVELDAFLNSDLIHWSVKTNAGTCDIKEVRFVYEHAV